MLANGDVAQIGSRGRRSTLRHSQRACFLRSPREAISRPRMSQGVPRCQGETSAWAGFRGSSGLQSGRRTWSSEIRPKWTRLAPAVDVRYDAPAAGACGTGV